MRNPFIAPLCAAASLVGISLATPLFAQAAATATPQGLSATDKPATISANAPAATALATPQAPQQSAATQTTAPDLRQLDRYQAHLSKTDFVGQLNTIFAPHGASAQTILIGNLGANIVTDADAERKSYYLLTFAPQSNAQGTVRDSAGRQVDAASLATAAGEASTHSEAARKMGRYWKTRDEIRAANSNAKSVNKSNGSPTNGGSPAAPLAGLHVALDPGHIGGNWAFMEQREWSFGGGPVFREGDFALRVAEILAEDLRALGATVTLVRDSKEPLTTKRPQDFAALAHQRLKARSGTEPTEQQVRRESELMFYRIAEIRARAEKVNDEIQPDVVVCLHVDGTSFPPAGASALPQGGTLHVLVSGAYSATELADNDQRLSMLKRLASGASAEEIALADDIARQLAIDTGLPPMTYTGPNAVRVNDNPFVWGRNLIANRLYDAPTVFIEAYTANREPFYQRFAHGEYEGTRVIDGKPLKNIYREYADSVRDALLRHYTPQK